MISAISRIFLSSLAMVYLASSCAGYRLEGRRPQALQNVRQIRVEMFDNKTLIPRGEALATNAVIDALSADGTYHLATVEKADATLHGTIDSITYNQVTSTRLDTLRSEEFENNITISWVLRDANNPLKILASGKATGSSRFAIDSNLQTARTNALPDALQRAATQVVGRLTDDY
jgi:hypothetical protein